jgi:hypothetical protein
MRGEGRGRRRAEKERGRKDGPLPRGGAVGRKGPGAVPILVAIVDQDLVAGSDSPFGDQPG